MERPSVTLFNLLDGAMSSQDQELINKGKMFHSYIPH